MADFQLSCAACGRITTEIAERCPDCGGPLELSTGVIAAEIPKKKCPYCAEEIQAAAIVCRFCQRDLNAPVQIPEGSLACKTCGHIQRSGPSSCDKCGNPLKGSAVGKGRRRWVPVVLVAVVAFGAWYVWATSAHSVDLAAAVEVVNDLTRTGVIKSLDCGTTNEALMSTRAWVSLPRRSQENLMNALARICISKGHDQRMTVVDATDGTVLARFNGWSIER